MSFHTVPIGHSPRGALTIAPLATRDAAAAQIGAALIIDCVGAEPHPSIPTLTCLPSAGRRAWSPHDLDRIVAAAAPVLRSGQAVVVHCEHGRSRSVTAAAAILVGLGDHSPTPALAVCRRGRGPAASAEASYWSWVHSRTTSI